MTWMCHVYIDPAKYHQMDLHKHSSSCLYFGKNIFWLCKKPPIVRYFLPKVGENRRKQIHFITLTPAKYHKMDLLTYSSSCLYFNKYYDFVKNPLIVLYFLPKVGENLYFWEKIWLCKTKTLRAIFFCVKIESLMSN
jgi:hypothetical protein